MIILDATGLLQSNATIIAGLLILLSFLAFKPPKIEEPKSPASESLNEMSREQRIRQQKEFEETKYKINKTNFRNLIITTTVLSYAIIGTIIPFSISASTISFGPLYLAKLIMAAGFAYLIFIIP